MADHMSDNYFDRFHREPIRFVQVGEVITTGPESVLVQKFHTTGGSSDDLIVFGQFCVRFGLDPQLVADRLRLIVPEPDTPFTVGHKSWWARWTR